MELTRFLLSFVLWSFQVLGEFFWWIMEQGVGETDPRTPMGPADRAPFGSAGGEILRRADRGEAHEQFT